jgi:hypothetical protein
VTVVQIEQQGRRVECGGIVTRTPRLDRSRPARNNMSAPVLTPTPKRFGTIDLRRFDLRRRRRCRFSGRRAGFRCAEASEAVTSITTAAIAGKYRMIEV